MANGFDVYEEYRKKKGLTTSVKRNPVALTTPELVYRKPEQSNTPSVKQPGGTLPKATVPKPLGIGFNQPTVKPQPLPYAKKVSPSLPRVDTQTLQKAQQVAKQPGDSNAMFYLTAAKSGLGNAAAGLQNTYEVGKLSAIEKMDGQKTDFVKLGQNVSKDKKLGDNIATIGNNIATNLTAAGDRRLSTIIRRWLTKNYVFTDDAAKKAGYADKDSMIDAVVNKALSADNWNDEIQQDYANLSEGKGGGQKIAGAVIQAVSQMAPSIASNMLLPGSGLPMMAGQVYGNSAMDALNQGATLQQAKNRAALTAATEAGSEKLFGGIPGLNKGLVKLGKFGDVLGEGVEEGFSAAVGGAIDRATFDPNAEDASWRDIVLSAALGAGTAGVMNLPGVAVDAINDIRSSEAYRPNPGENEAAARMAGQLDRVYGANKLEGKAVLGESKATPEAVLGQEQQTTNKPAEILRLYHGTANGGNFDSFSEEFLGNSKLNHQLGQGFYFTDNKQEANSYLKNYNAASDSYSAGSNPYLHEVDVKIENPFVIGEMELPLDRVKTVFMEGDNNWFFDSHLPRILGNKEIDGVKRSTEQLKALSKEEKIDLLLSYESKIGDGRGVLQYSLDAYKDQAKLIDSMRRNFGYDAIVDRTNKNTTQYVVFDPGKIAKATAANSPARPALPYNPNTPKPIPRNPAQGKFGGNTVGAAQPNVGSYANLQTEHGVVDPGENPVRMIDMPVKDAEGRRTSLFARTVAESESMPTEMVPEWEQAVASGEFSHDIATDKAANRHAERELSKGWDHAMSQWQAVSEGGKIATKNDLALGQLLLANAMKDGDTQTAMKLTAELCAEATRAGQAVQSFRLLKKMTPEGMLYYLQKTVNNLNSDFEGRKGFEGIKIDEGMAERLGKATTREEMNAIVDEIKHDIAAQTPVTWYDKWNAWRYLSMLGNPTTQVRNVLGNALFVPAVKAKNLIATGIEAAWKKTGHLPYATKAVLTSKDKALVDFADKDFANVVQEIQGGGKYSDKDEILGNRQIFDNKVLEGWRNLTNTVMDKGDEIFSRHHYKTSLAQYMKANEITPEMLEEGRAFYSPIKSELESKPDATITQIPGKTPTSQEYKKTASDNVEAVKNMPWYGKQLTNKDADYAAKYGTLTGAITFKQTLKKGRSYDGRYSLEQIQIMPYLDKIFENAVVIKSHKDSHGRSDVSRVVTLLSPISFEDGRKGVVKLNVFEYAQPNQQNKVHENKILEIVDAELDTTGKTAKKIETGFNPVPQLSPLGIQEGPVSAMSVAEMLGYVKGDDAKYLPPAQDPRKVFEMARQYAIQEAQRATYRDASSVASLVNRAKRTLANTANNKENDLGKRAAARAGEVLLEGFVPFTKTPVNIVKRGIEYSPIGLAQGTINLVRSVKNGEVDAAAAIDRMAAGLTGSGLLALGAWLASLGLVSGGPGEDDREEKYKGMLGEQDYALKLGDTTYTIDWMAPEALPFFTGVELYKEMSSKDGITLADTIGLISAMSDPVVELSMLSSMNSTFESIKYSQGDALSTVAGNLITSYLGQGIPTIGGKIARTIDETSRQTYYDPNKTGIVKSADAFRQKAQAKIPFAANALPERVDLWGRTEKNTGGNVVGRFFYNMLSPGYAETKNITKVDNELLRLAEATGDSNVYPDTADKTFKVKGESVKLDSKQYTKFAKTKGQTAFEILEAAVDSNTYKKMTDAEKADFVKDVYEYANAKAKAEVSSYQLDGKNMKIAEAEKKGIKPAQYLTITGGYDKDGNGSVTQEEAKAVLDKSNLTMAQKAYMWKLQNKSWKNNPYER